MALSNITNHASQAAARLAAQFRDQANWALLLGIISARAQGFEDEAFLAVTSYQIDSATGDQLDTLGAIVGAARAGASDAAYRVLIKARVKANRSNGSIPELVDIAQAFFGAGTVDFTDGVGSYILHLSGVVVTLAEAQIAADLLGDGDAAGIRGFFSYQTALDDDTFTLAQGSTVAGYAVAAGAVPAQLAVQSHANLPSSGTVTVNPGTTAEEEIAYTAKSANTAAFPANQVLLLTGNMLATPETGAGVELKSNHDDTNTGLGDSAVPATGGEISGIIVAS